MDGALSDYIPWNLKISLHSRKQQSFGLFQTYMESLHFKYFNSTSFKKINSWIFFIKSSLVDQNGSCDFWNFHSWIQYFLCFPPRSFNFDDCYLVLHLRQTSNFRKHYHLHPYYIKNLNWNWLHSSKRFALSPQLQCRLL